MPFSRRQIALGAGALGGLALAGGIGVRGLRTGGIGLGGVAAPGRRPRFLSGCTDTDGQHFVACVDGRGELAFRHPIADRGHEAIVSADGLRAILFARRPGTVAYAIDLTRGRVNGSFRSGPGRHFYGHGVYSDDGKLIYTTENDFQRGDGRIVVRDAASFQVAREFPSYGIGPHEMRWMSDRRTLVVANGGIRTHPDRPREILNLDSMAPNLAYVDARSGAPIARQRMPNRQLSIRHLDVTADDEVLVGFQYEGDPSDNVPVVAVSRPGGGFAPIDVPSARLAQLRQYTASVCVDPVSGNALVTCPRGNRVTFWNVGRGAFLGSERVPDAAGVSLDREAGEFVVTNGRGAIHRFDSGTLEAKPSSRVRHAGLMWDNHLTRV